LSASPTRLSIPGTAAQRRSPGRRLPGLGRAIYLLPPLLAVLVVVGVQLLGPNATLPADRTGPVLSVTDPGDVALPQTEVSSIGAVDTADIDRRIEFWRQRSQSSSPSEDNWTSLGDVFDLKGRMTGDISQFLAAQQAYQTAVSIAPNSSTAHAGNARELATLHDFNGALVEATATLDLNPNALGALGVVFDASVELGHIDDARLALAALRSLIDSPSVAVRSARLDFITGDTASAVTAAEAAAADSAAAGDMPTSVAFYEYTAAEYQLLAGDLDAADENYAAALELLPGYPLAVYGEARVAFAQKDLPTAIALMDKATTALPRPDMLAFLGDLYTLSGDAAKAADQYAAVDFIDSLTASSGAGDVYDREYGLFLSDHVRDPARALALASDELNVRKDVYGYDAYGWALHANGRDAEALAAMDKALAQGTADARLYLHAGLIEIATGHTDAGKAHLSQALALNPTVSPLVVDQARKVLGQ
jgi:tetratricopeptide (TPR) repeat protein